ncbi:MAG: FAD-dependent monooxygenase [Gammaproteobacteria bacterium]|nr:FAD-dependent monooxygenase [Gammaproteobacteria bacterium]
MAKRFQVLVVGGGLVGAAAALGIERIGYSVALFERAAPRETRGRLGFDARMIALAPKWKDFLEVFGDGAWHHHGQFERLLAWEELGTAQVSFDAADVGAAQLGFMASMSDLQTRLWTQVEASSIEVFLGEHIEDIDVGVEHVTIGTGAEVQGSLLISADGASSRVRDLLNLDRTLRPTGQSAIVTVVEVSEHHANTARQRFLHDGPLALLPLDTQDDRHVVSIVWSQSDAQAQRRAALDERAFCEELTDASEGCLGEVRTADERFCLPLEQQVSESFTPSSRTLLLGDSARVLHPLAGQGANLGLEDVEALLEVLQHRPSDPGANRLWRDFSRLRGLRSKSMVAAMSFFRHVYAIDDPTFSWLRNLGVRFVDQFDPVKQLMLKEALGDSLLARMAEKVKWPA